MLEMRKVLDTKLNKKGFTLAELLVVVAIIAILVAVSIPIFTGKLNEARTNTDNANLRAAKAAAVTEYLSDDTAKTGYYDAKNGTIVKTFAEVTEKYNKLSSNGSGANTAVVYVEIKEGSSTDKPKVETRWVTAQQ